MNLKELKVGVIGGGVVGKATARCWIEHVAEVRVYDLMPYRRTHSLPATLECDVVFVCLPTPAKGGALDIGWIERFFDPMRFNGTADADWIIPDRGANYVLRSTVPIGTTRMLRERYGLKNLVHSPEFLTARCADVDVQMPSRNVIGGQWEGINQSTACGNVLLMMYRHRFPGIPVHLMPSDASEAVKLIQNAFFAVKVSFWNECFFLTRKLGLEWEPIRKAILADGRIHPSHTQVPGPDGKFGFGGECLPKDLAHLATTVEKCFPGETSVMFAAAIRNLEDRQRS